MKTMQLSDAVRLGSLLMLEPRAGRSDRCAVGMALLANGIKPLGYFSEYGTLMLLYPWLGMIFPCRWCYSAPTYHCVLAHPFDSHVMTGQITIDEMCGWIASIEPPPWAWGLTEEDAAEEGFSTRAKPVLAVPA